MTAVRAQGLDRLPEGGPYFDDLHAGLRTDAAPAVTLSAGHAAMHQAIVGDRLRLALDAGLSRTVLGTAATLAHPALVWDVAIGQSTLLTRRVMANLFYRGLAFRRAPVIGDTLFTSTEVVALRQNRPRPGRGATGLAVLRIRTVDQRDRPVLDFWRCAMLPLSAAEIDTGAADELDAVSAEIDAGGLATMLAQWDLAPLARRAATPAAALAKGRTLGPIGGDVVSCAPELARLTLNVAVAHHDATASGRRLVYGGHTIGIAASHVSRALPDLVTIAAWHSCDHTAPVYEGDTLFTEVTVERTEPLPTAGALVHLRARVKAVRAAGEEETEVLDWRLVGVVA